MVVSAVVIQLGTDVSSVFLVDPHGDSYNLRFPHDYARVCGTCMACHCLMTVPSGMLFCGQPTALKVPPYLFRVIQEHDQVHVDTLIVTQAF